MNDAHALLRLPAVQQETGDGRSRVYSKVVEGLLTKPVKIGPRAVAWPAGEIRQINIARIAGKGDDEIRDLVRRLHEDRKAAA